MARIPPGSTTNPFCLSASRATLGAATEMLHPGSSRRRRAMAAWTITRSTWACSGSCGSAERSQRLALRARSLVARTKPTKTPVALRTLNCQALRERACSSRSSSRWGSPHCTSSLLSSAHWGTADRQGCSPGATPAAGAASGRGSEANQARPPRLNRYCACPRQCH